MRLALLLLLTLVLIAPTFAADPIYEYANDYTVWSDISDGYWNAIRNERTDATLTNWTTGYGQWTVGTIPGAWVLPEALFPLPEKTILPRPWYNAFYSSDLPPIIVDSTIWWSDGRTAHAPIYMPSDAPVSAIREVVPEPSGLLALGVGVGGMCAWRRRRYVCR